jgi:hypothetical protein
MAQPITNLLINGANPVTVGGTGTAIKYFPAVPGASIGVASLKNGILFVPGNGEGNSQRMAVRACGNFTIGTPGVGVASPAVTVALYPVTFPNSAAVANSNPSAQALTSTAVIGSTPIVTQTFAAASDAGGYYPWALTVDLQGDTLSGLVQQVAGNIVIDGTAGTFTPGLVTGLTGINFSNPVPYGLVVGVTFSVSDAQALSNMYQFDLQL